MTNAGHFTAPNWRISAVIVQLCFQKSASQPF